MIAARPPRRASVLGPVLLIGLGAVARLVTSGALGTAAVDRLLQLWPLVLVLLGVQIVVLRLLPGRAGALGAAVAMLAVIALAVGFAFTAPAAATTTDRASAPLAGVAAGTLTIDAGRGTVHVVGQDLGDDLYRATVAHPAGARPTVEGAGGTVRLAATGSRAGLSWLSPASAGIDLALSSRVPWTLTIDAGGLAGQLDLTGLEVSRVTLNGAASRLDLRLPAEPRGTVTIAVNGVGLDLTARLPRGTGVRATIEGLPAGLDVNGTAVNGAAWSSTGLDTAAGHYEIRARGVASHVRLETMP